MVDDLTALKRNLAGSDDADRARQG
jgi:hypothetical protein